MNSSEYQQFVRETSSYPEADAFSYIALDLCGAAGKLAAIVRKVAIGDNSREPEALEALGNVMWHVVALVNKVGEDIQVVAMEAIYHLPNPDDFDRTHGALKLVGYSGLIAIHANFLRQGESPQEHIGAIREYLSRIIAIMTPLCLAFGFDLVAVCAENAAKLKAA